MSSYSEALHKALKEEQITIVCESPLELESYDDQGNLDGTATGFLAQTIIDLIAQESSIYEVGHEQP